MSKYGISDLSSVQTNKGGKSELVLPQVLLDLFDFKSVEGKWVTFRLFGDIMSFGNYWIAGVNKQGVKKRFPQACPSFNYLTGQRESGKYDPWWEVEQHERNGSEDNKSETVQFTRSFFINAIVRSEQDNEPAKIRKTPEEAESGFKDKDSSSWTPVKVLRMPPSLLQKIQELKPLNSVKFKNGSIKCFDVTHPIYGRDIQVKFDDSASPANKYSIQLGMKRTPLTEEEKEYLTYDLDALYYVPKEEEVKRSFEVWAKRSGYSKKVEDETEDNFDMDKSEEEDEAPTPVKKPLKKPAKKIVQEDEDGDDFDEDDEDEEVDVPLKKGSKKIKKVVEEDDEEEEKTPVKKSAKRKQEEDEEDIPDFDEDEDEEDSEEEEDETPKKPVKKPVKKAPVKKVVEEEDEDDFEDDDDSDQEEEEERPKKPVKKPTKKPAKKVVDEEDDFDFDDDEF